MTDSSTATRDKYLKAFNKAYQTLNTNQRAAVDAVDGAVLVNAGPGTGKTQILATRIGNILRTQDVAPYNILCLTYTEAATIAMRKRLTQFIGPTAHQIHIHTFHGFCNQVIQDNLDIFGKYKQLEPITDLETVDVLRTLLDNLPEGNPLKRHKHDRYFEVDRLKNLFQLMKRENLQPDLLLKDIQAYLDSLPQNPDYHYKRKTTDKKTGKVYVKGDVKEKDVNKEIAKYRELIAAIKQFDYFKELMSQAERYDYADMILWVIKHFQEDENLLLQYQERYQYFLVDEYQDTNGSQNEILQLLISYWDNPNVFVVGDDDQAIFKFQGANLGNILDFEKVHQPQTIILEENYRSNQHILDRAKELISANEERMVAQIEGLSKNLIASGKAKSDNTLPQIREYDKTSHEIADLVKSIKAQYDADPASLKETAIIYRKHRQVEEVVSVMEKLNIPLNIKKRVDVLKLPLTKNLISILSYLQEEMHLYGYGQHRIFEILHYKHFGNDPLDIGKLALYCQKKIKSTNNQDEEQSGGTYPKWREVIADSKILDQLELNNKTSILRTSAFLESLMSEVPSVTIQTLFEIILNDSGLLSQIMMAPDKAWQLQVITTFFNLIKKETAKNPDMDIKELLMMIKKMEESNIALPINKTITSENGLNFLTAHAAKGLEFQKVYMIGCIQNTWDNVRNFRNKQYSVPPVINADSENNIEDERRLFFVAMTRAKTDLILTYSNCDIEGKELATSQFIDEIKRTDNIEHLEIEVAEEDVFEFYLRLVERQVKQIPLIEKDLIDKWLEGYKLSVTHLNKYLRCPLRFYFESILKVPSARNAFTGFGTAMHHALNKFFETITDPEKQNIDRLLFFFEESMLRHKSHFTTEEYDNFLIHGKQSLTTLHTAQLTEWLQVPKYKLEAELSNAVYKGIPLTGFIDKVEIYKDHVHVVDYKTGKYKSDKLRHPKGEDEPGGDYWRQLVFYKMLIDSDKKYGWIMSTGKIAFIEPDRKSQEFTTKELVVTPDDTNVVGKQIVDTMDKIKAYDFNKTCDDKECRWCNFVENNYQFKSTTDGEENIPSNATAAPVAPKENRVYDLENELIEESVSYSKEENPSDSDDEQQLELF